MFREIVLHDYSRKLADRLQSRRTVGPYRWQPTTPNKERGFYMGAGSTMGDSTFRLRVVYTGDTFTDWESDTTFEAIVLRLPRGRGFLAGWTMGDGMLSACDPEISPDYDTAARWACGMAERACSDESEYQAEWRQANEAREDVAGHWDKVRACLAQIRDLTRALDCSHLSGPHIASRIAELWDELRDARKAAHDLTREWGKHEGFAV